MGRGKSGMAGGSNGAEAEPAAPPKTLVSKTQVDELTSHFTTDMFLGSDFEDTFMNTPNSLENAIESNMPQSLDIGGYTFTSMGDPIVQVDNKKNVAVMDYQCTEQIGNEFPILQVGISAYRTKGGKVKAEVIRSGYMYKTRFL